MHDLTHQIRAHIGGFGVDTSTDTAEQSDSGTTQTCCDGRDEEKGSGEGEEGSGEGEEGGREEGKKSVSGKKCIGEGKGRGKKVRKRKERKECVIGVITGTYRNQKCIPSIRSIRLARSGHDMPTTTNTRPTNQTQASKSP